MSNISNRHTITKFISGESKPLVTQRLAKIGYKSSTDKATKKTISARFPSVCVSLPHVDPAAVPFFAEQLTPFLVSLIETAQDGIIRSLYETSGGLRTEITDEEISIPACIAYMIVEATGSRLSEESIGSWFESDIRDNLIVLIADKLGFDLSTPEQEETVQKHVKLHKDVICVLAGKNVVLSPRQESGIKNMLKIASDTSTGLGAKIEARFVAVTAKKSDESELLDIGA